MPQRSPIFKFIKDKELLRSHWERGRLARGQCAAEPLICLNIKVKFWLKRSKNTKYPYIILQIRKINSNFAIELQYLYFYHCYD